MELIADDALGVEGMLAVFKCTVCNTKRIYGNLPQPEGTTALLKCEARCRTHETRHIYAGLALDFSSVGEKLREQSIAAFWRGADIAFFPVTGGRNFVPVADRNIN